MSFDMIVEIIEMNEMDAIDIEVSGNHYFFANEILTHNSNSDPGLEDTSESFGLPATADFMFALVSNEELQQLNQMLVKQLKNRYNDPNLHKRFTIGVDRAKMKLYDLEQKAQDAVMQEPEPSKPVFDRGKSKDKFKNLKV
jgi:hypothetical protein